MPSIESIIKKTFLLGRAKHELKKQRVHEKFEARHAKTTEFKDSEAECSPKRFFPVQEPHLEGERTKRRREARDQPQSWPRDSEHFIEYQLQTGAPPLDQEAPKPSVQHSKTMRMSHLVSLPQFPQVFGTQVTSFDPEYVQRKSEVGEKYFRLPDGRRLCYYEDHSVDGEPDDVAVLAFHDGCEDKSRFIQKEPIPGVRFVAIDRPGYGGSSQTPGNYTFKCAVQDIQKLADYLDIQEFVVLGHGVGGAWAQQLAAALPDRVRGAILWSSMVDPMHPKATGDVRRAVGYVDAVQYCNSGRVGRSPRHFMRGTSTAVAKDDFGALGLKQEQEAGAESFEKFATDPFWVSAMVDAWRPNRNRKSILEDVSRTLCNKWQYDAEDIKCPVFVFHGDGDRDAKSPAVPNFLQEVIPHANIFLLEGCAHICSFGPDEATRSHIQQAINGMPPLASERPRCEPRTEPNGPALRTPSLQEEIEEYHAKSSVKSPYFVWLKQNIATKPNHGYSSSSVHEKQPVTKPISALPRYVGTLQA